MFGLNAIAWEVLGWLFVPSVTLSLIAGCELTLRWWRRIP
jgi:hypothetical protein